ncbi:L-seryl-tRNA(Sec) selenium transferase [Bacillus sp. THAF10]|uniref:L-seryl-tRNA(Sec) selenium transferase n=1 Tax=Bacillus sp. THAF10 TaxID=2587848 RepID=UPI001269322A|nr:L-seryl-tRNA(Sec) selenium transferase [Bacillus sp. THAF10]QFT89005.1 L-seryl-tRNA(Sec) selenium transferase [Bacillus sp. THAF10]
MKQQLLRSIPSIHELQTHSAFVRWKKKYNVDQEFVTNVMRQCIQTLRNEILLDQWHNSNMEEEIVNRVESLLKKKMSYRLQSVINATGTILHTNLGRARLSREAIKRMEEVASNYSNLEYNLDSGIRGSRHDIVEDLIKEVTGAEAAIVVNNNAAAVYFILHAFGKNKEIIVSRGQLVEIGGSFRISSIMEESGAILKEVGTTNKTHLTDYQEAINENTAMLLKVHTSNFKTIGFTKTVSTDELVSLKNIQDDIIVYEDLGSGVLYDFTKKGIGDEPVVQRVIASGVDLVSFSGDKLLGGPQAGIIAGRKEYIDQLKKHQLARVLRVDKMSFAGLEATLQAYATNQAETIPTIRDMLLSQEEVKEKAETFLSLVEELTFNWTLEPTTSMVGGGTMPDVSLPSYAVGVTSDRLSSKEIADCLRMGTPKVIVRIQDEQVLLDFRTITSSEIPQLIKAFQQI